MNRRLFHMQAIIPCTGDYSIRRRLFHTQAMFPYTGDYSICRRLFHTQAIIPYASEYPQSPVNVIIACVWWFFCCNKHCTYFHFLYFCTFCCIVYTINISAPILALFYIVFFLLSPNTQIKMFLSGIGSLLLMVYPHRLLCPWISQR